MHNGNARVTVRRGRPRRIGRDIYFTNLPALVMGGFRPAAGIGAGWVPFEYALDEFGGVGIATGALSPAGELVLDLGLKGWHILHFCHTSVLDIWLDGEKGPRCLAGPQAGNAVRDFPLHAADLTGRRLHLAPKRGFDPCEAILFYIRAEPCSCPRAGARNLVATEDGDGLLRGGVSGARDIYRYLAPYRGSDFFRVLWGVYGGGDFVAGPAAPFTGVPLPAKDWFSASDRLVAAAIRRIRREGHDPLALAVEAAHDVGLEIHFYVRVGAFYGPFPRTGWTSRLYADHPEWRCKDEFGREVKRISYAFEGVQDHLLAYYERLLTLGPDGICLAFNRGLPLMVCEAPVLREFRRRYGRAPRLPREADDSRMLTVRQEMLAGFITRARALTDRHGKALSCIVPRNFEENRRRGLDIAMCAERRLFESIHVGAGHEDNPAFTQRTHQPPVDQDDLGPVHALKVSGGGRVYLGGCAGHGTFWPAGDPGTRARRMEAIHASGLDGAYFWDTNQWFARDWEHIRHYGNRRYIERLLNGRIPVPKRRETLRIADLTVDRYSPWNAC